MVHGGFHVPKRDTPANFHWFITVLCGHRRIRAEVEGTGTSHPWCTPCDTSWNFVATTGEYSLSFFLSFFLSSLCHFHQLAFDSKLRPPPIHAHAFRSVPQPPPTINAIHTKPILASYAPDLAQCPSTKCALPSVCTHPVGLSLRNNPADSMPPHQIADKIE